MTSTTFVSGTIVTKEWLNDVNTVTYKNAVSPLMYGATGDGVADDTAGIVAALAVNSTLDMRKKSWKISASITLPSNCTLDLRGATIAVSTGSTPVFKFLNASSGLAILGAGCVITGTCDSILFAEGSTTTPAVQGDYANQIRIDGLNVSGTAITKFLDFSKAVRQIYVTNCQIFTVNGINASGKCVEFYMDKTTLFSATGVAGTYGIKLRSPAGGAYYNEGWHVSTCTIDNFELSFDITDIYVLTVVNSYVGCNATLSATTGYAFNFRAPTSTLCDSINIGSGCVFSGRINFLLSAGGQAYNAVIGGCVFVGVPNQAISLHNNACNVKIQNCYFKAGSGTAYGVVGDNNNNNITAENLTFDSTYASGVILNGSVGVNNVVGPLQGPTTGDLAGFARIVQFRGIPVASTTQAAYMLQLNAADLAATRAVGVAIATQTIAFVKGEKGYIVGQLPCSGMTAATQRFDLAIPTGMVLPTGSGWNSAFIYPSAVSTLVTFRIPYYCTADGGGTLSITNAVGSSVTLNSHGHFGIERSWGG